MNRIILDLCGGTGSWSKPYKDAGYIVKLITLPDHDVRNWRGDANILNYLQHAYGILAAPPCTMFSIARKSTAKLPRNFQEGMEVVKACLEIIWASQGNAEKPQLKFWCIENPVGYLRQFLGDPDFTFRQCEYGEVLRKRTDLWGRFNRPRPTSTCDVVEHSVLDKKWQRMKSLGPGLNRADMRAVTPPGFAQAFFKANP